MLSGKKIPIMNRRIHKLSPRVRRYQFLFYHRFILYQVRFSALRKECIKHNTYRYQYSCEFELSAISFAKQYAAMPQLFANVTTGTPLMSKYKAVQIIGISGKMLQHWVRDEDTIL